MRSKTWTLWGALALAVAAGGVRAEVTDVSDDELTLGPVSHPVLRVGGAYPAAPTNLYPLAAAGTRAEGALAAFNPPGNRTYEMIGYQIGMPVSQQPKDFYIGQYCDRFPDNDPSRVDWNKTYANLAGEIEAGAVFVNRDATDPARRILFTLGGRATTIKWEYYDVAGHLKEQTDIYQICEVSATRPHRLYWTEAPFNAPAVNLQGKFVKLCGNPEIITPLMETNEVSKTVSVRRGIWFDQSSQTLRAKAELTGDGYVGPKGQFVLCYYRSGDCRDADFICSIVVEVGEPKQTELEAEVGDELFPSGDGWSIEGLNPKVSKGAEKSDDDPMSPYAEIFEHTDGTTGNKVQSVYAVTPDDAASVGAGMDAPWKIDIYWQSPDPMDTLWPFERAWYKVTWPEACDRVIYAADAPLGAGVLVPTNYTASLCGYQSPNGTAALNGQAVRVMRDGRFTVKLLQGTERVFYVPFVSCASTSTNVVNTEASAVRRVAVGTELTPNFNELAGGTAGESYLTVDETLPGYIHQPNSKGRNWNARLYHDPLVPQPVDTSAATEIGAESVDPFAKAKSAIYPVSASSDPIEVWWRSSAYPFSLRYEAPAALEFPSSVQRYVAEWPEHYQIPEIVLASQLGSEGLSLQESGTAAFWLDAKDSVRLEDYEGGPTFGLVKDQDWGFGLWLNRGSRNALLPGETAGRLFTLKVEDCGLAFTVDSDGAGQLTLGSASAISNASARVSFASNEWTYVWGSIYLDAVVDAQGRTNDTYQLEMGAASVRRPDESLPAALRVELTAEQYAQLTVGCVSNLVLGAAGNATAALGVAVDDVFLMRQKTNAERTLDDEDDTVWFGFAFGDCDYWPEWDEEDLSWLDNPWQNVTLCFFDNESFTYLRGTSGVRTMSPGAPRVTDGRVPSDEATPEVYRQTDKNGVGYHLNLAHAFTAQAEGGTYTTWAVRSDLVANPYEEGLVFTMYVEGGRNRMRTFAVALTNEYYSDFSSSVTVGKQMLPPKPLCLLDGYWNANNSWTAVEANNGEDKTIVYRDRKLNDWAKRDGGGYAFYHYKVREDFDWPSGNGAKAGEYTPWVKGLGWYWSAEWPTPDTVPTMRVAQTLTKAKDMLPEVWNMASCAVIYPDPSTVSNIVDLIDPVTKQGVDLKVSNDFVGEYGFTLGNSGTVQMRDGKYYFVGTPASVSDRFFYDPNAATNQLFLVGQLVEPATGDPYLQINTLTAQEARELKDLCKLPKSTDPKKDFKGNWDKAIDALAAKQPILPSKPDPKTVVTWDKQTPAYVQERFVTNVLTRLQMKEKYGDAVKVTDVSNVVTKVEGLVQAKNVRPDYLPVSNYALMASGNDAGYVTIIENDNPDTEVVEEGLPVNVKVIRVVPELYAGTIRPLVDPLNKLSEKLVIQYNEPFGKAVTDFTFEWRRRAPAADGTIDRNYDLWTLYASGEGLTSFVLGTNGTSLAELANTYYVMRYEPKAETMAARTVGNAKSDFIGPTLAEGWVQRVLNALTPFAQRVEDFYSNPSDIWYTMFEQIGKPFRGDVALNNANLTEVGLLELYQTIFNKAEKLSIANGVSDLGVNKQLLLAASRIADFYMLLGAEAYADAKNPLVEQTSVDGMEDSALALPSSTFCFQNQVRTLLDEELALLRGRTCANQPDMKTQPIYNRLIWNFTKGITEGEVAYVNNYGIRATDGVLTVDQAAKQYPQGHGDAWGHYLSAITGYYRLLRNPNFGWTASMMEMMISQSVVNNDDADEQKFADAALKLAQTGLDTVDLTARKAWRDNAGDPMAAYFDSEGAKIDYAGGTVREGFGYGQWATRAGLGGIYNWAVVNSLLPTNGEPAAVYADKGLRQITRATATQLASLCDTVNAIQQKVNTLDAGLNPLGLDPNAIPMDIDPSELESKNSHFDQLLARTERALENAETVLAYANRYGARLKQIQNAETDAIAAAEAQEREYDKQLIELYGKPYSGDIGPGGLYVQGYDGPDLYHYMWMDTSTYGINENALGGYADTNITYYVQTGKGTRAGLNADATGKVAVHFEFDKSGVLKVPAKMGSRAYEGRIQDACRVYLAALGDYTGAVSSYNGSMENFKTELSYIIGLYAAKTGLGAAEKIYETTKLGLQTAIRSTQTARNLTEVFTEFAKKSIEAASDSIPKVTGAGLTVVMDPHAIANIAMSSVLLSQTTLKTGKEITFSTALKAFEVQLAWIDWADKMANYAIKVYEDEIGTWQKVKSLCSDSSAKASAVRNAARALSEAHVAIVNLLDEGQRLQREREAVREKISNAATQYRYMDMYNRVQRNNALTKYSASFDIAQRYVWELAKVYDYETGALSADGESGASFLAEAIAARQLGEKGVATEQATDKGLWDIVTRMKENWEVEKGRLGVNNPDTMTKTFSLRYELFRIRPDVSGDAAWRKELAKYWVDDLKSNADYVRFCQPLASQTATVVKEPGLVIPFSTSINNAENFFGRTLQGGETQFSSADYVTKIHAVGVDFAGYDALTQQTAGGLATEPNVYLVPAGTDYMRSPAGDRAVLGWSVVDQVMPLPYKVGSTQLDDESWIAGLDGTDGGSASGAVIRRHSTLRANGGTTSSRLVGRSVWNDRWILVIPASSLNANRVQGLETFIKGVSDIKLAIKAYSRQGN